MITKIKLVDGTELKPILATGASKHVQGASRDVLTFVFPESNTLDEIDNLFSAENCESISIFESIEEADDTVSETEWIHKGYVIRVELARKPIEITPATTDTAATYENRVTISMGQRTYSESQVANLTETVDALVLDSLLAE